MRPPRRRARRITAITFPDRPEPDLMTGFTDGLSTWQHPDWRHGRPELALSVASRDPAWASVPAFVAAGLAGRAPFSYGDTIRSDAAIAGESAMTAFVIADQGFERFWRGHRAGSAGPRRPPAV